MHRKVHHVFAHTALGVLLGAVALGAYFRFRGQTAPAPPAESALVHSIQSPANAVGPDAAPADAGAARSGPCPEDMTLVDGDFCPDLVHACAQPTGAVGCAVYARETHCRGRPTPKRFCIDVYEWPNVVGENPRVYVDWFEAKGLCASKNRRLCARSEWMLACEGPKRMPYPWGYVRQPSPCNIDRAVIPFDVYALVGEETREAELARLWQADRIGSHKNCVSSYGAFDMSGNVDEWTDDKADDPMTKHPSTLNGGYWGPVRDGCRPTTTSHGPDFKFYQVGFRCCADAAEAREDGGLG